MLILVTGATGRIGSHLTRALVRAGHTVRALVVPGDPRAAALDGLGVEQVVGRLESRDAVTAAARGVAAVYHLGGALTSRGNTDEEFFEYNVRGTFNLLMAVRDQAPRLRRFVYASSDAVYFRGGTHGACYLPIDEAHPRIPGTVYGASKVSAEELCLSFWRGYSIPVTILRFGATADARELVTPTSTFARWLFLRAATEHLSRATGGWTDEAESLAILRGLDNGTEQLVVLADRDGRPEVRQWADACDIAAGCMQVLDTPAAVGEAFNLSGTAPFSLDELVRYIAAELGLGYVRARLPIARAAWYHSSAKARDTFGYEPRRTVFDMVDEAVGCGPHHRPPPLRQGREHPRPPAAAGGP